MHYIPNIDTLDCLCYCHPFPLHREDIQHHFSIPWLGPHCVNSCVYKIIHLHDREEKKTVHSESTSQKSVVFLPLYGFDRKILHGMNSKPAG